MEKKIAASEKIAARLLSENRIEEGIKYLELTLQLKGDVFGSCSDESWLTLEKIIETTNTHAMILLEQGDYANSLKYLKRAKQLTAGQGWSQLANISRLRCRAITLNNLACFCRKKGKFQEALNYVKNAIEIESSLEITDVENPAGTILNMCAILSQLGRHEEALACARKAMAFLQSQALTPSNASSIAIAYHNLGVEQEYLRMPREVFLATYKEGLEFCENHLGPESQLTLSLKEAFTQAKGPTTRPSNTKVVNGGKQDTPKRPFKKPIPVPQPTPADEFPEDDEVARINQSHLERSSSGPQPGSINVDRTSSGFGQVEMDIEGPGQRSQTSMSRYDVDDDSDDDYLPPKLEELRRRIQNGFGVSAAREWTPSLDPNRGTPSPSPASFSSQSQSQSQSQKPVQPGIPPERSSSSRGKTFGRASRVQVKPSADPAEALADQEVANINPTPSQESYDLICTSALVGDVAQLKSLTETADPHSVPIVSSWGATALHCASAAGHFSSVRHIVEKVANVDVKLASQFPLGQDKMRGSSPLHWAALSWRGSNAPVVDYLLKKGASVECADEYGYTPVHYAAARGDYDSVVSLMKNGANPRAVSRIKGYSPMHIAAASGRDSIVRYFAEVGMGVDIRAKSGETCLELAARGGHKQVVDLLLRLNADYSGIGDLSKEEDLEPGEVSELIMAFFGGGFAGGDEDDLHLVRWVGALDRLRLAALFSSSGDSDSTQEMEVNTYAERLQAKPFFHGLSIFVSSNRPESRTPDASPKAVQNPHGAKRPSSKNTSSR